jgi:NAD(P)-dependent dehydrogenase (short-subunit alcohol dehydrogenase family)
VSPQRWSDGHRFEGRRVIVAGGSGVLGSAVSSAFAREGGRVVLSYRGREEAAQTLAGELRGAGGEAHALHLDVTDERSVGAFTERAVSELGGIDVLVNAFGRIDAMDAVRFEQVDVNAWRQLFKVDVEGTMLMCRAAVPHLRAAGGGVIVNFSGSYGNGVTQENMVNSVAVQYCAAKGAIRALTASLARDLAPTIRVNAVAPGPIEADWEADWDIPPEHMEEAVAMTPLKRLGQPDEIAEAVLFLSSDGGGYMTGQILQIDGGWILAG